MSEETTIPGQELSIKDKIDLLTEMGYSIFDIGRILGLSLDIIVANREEPQSQSGLVLGTKGKRGKPIHVRKGMDIADMIVVFKALGMSKEEIREEIGRVLTNIRRKEEGKNPLVRDKKEEFFYRATIKAIQWCIKQKDYERAIEYIKMLLQEEVPLTGEERDKLETILQQMENILSQASEKSKSGTQDGKGEIEGEIGKLKVERETPDNKEPEDLYFKAMLTDIEEFCSRKEFAKAIKYIKVLQREGILTKEEQGKLGEILQKIEIQASTELRDDER